MQNRVPTAPLTLAQAFHEQALRHPELEAVRTAEGAVAYGPLEGWANRLARAVLATPGSGPVAVLPGPDPALEIAALLACLKAGRPYAVLDPGGPALRTRAILEDLGGPLVLAHHRHRVPGALEVNPAPEGPDPGPPDVAVDPEAPACILYTSGRSGAPRGVVRSHRAILHRVSHSLQVHRPGPGDRVSHLASCRYAASQVDVFGALLAGATLCCHRPSGTASLARWLEEEEITLLHPPVTLLRRLMHSLEAPPRVPRLRLVALAGEPLHRSDLERFWRLFPHVPVEHRLSSTEGLHVASLLLEPGHLPDTPLVPVGRPAPDKDVALVDEAGRPVPPGEPGEILVTSDFLASGYWGDLEGTRRVFGRDPQTGRPRLRTGDLARLGPDGLLHHLGRRDDLVKVRGHRVHLGEVEAALLACPGVREAACVAVPDPHGQVALRAFLVGGDEDLREALRQRLPDSHLPSLTFLDALPVTPTGKVDRQALAQRGQPRRHPPATAGEVLLAELWREVLGLEEEVGSEDDFFDLGGDSLRAADLLERIAAAVGQRLDPEALVRFPTLARLAARMEGEGTGTGRVITLAPEGEGPALYLVPGGSGGVYELMSYRRVARQLGRPVHGLEANVGGEAPPVPEMARRCLEEVLAHSQGRPFVLAGECFGAVVAAEMASQWAEAGGSAPLLLLDGAPPVPWDRLRKPWRHSPLLRAPRATLQQALDEGGPSRMLRRITEGARRFVAPSPPPSPGIDPDLYWGLRRRYGRQVRRHRPRVLPGPVAVLCTAELAGPARRWRRLAPRGVRFALLPGDHSTYLRQYAADTARLIVECLEALA